MREVRHAVMRAKHPGQQFNAREDCDEPLGLEGYRRKDQREHIVRIEHAEAQQQAVDGAGSADGRNVGQRLGEQHQLVAEGGTQPAHEVEDQELLAAPEPFEHRTEHDERPHVEEDMHEVAVHEHVGYELPPAEKGRADGEEGEPLVHRVTDQFRADKDNDIDDEQVLDCRG